MTNQENQIYNQDQLLSNPILFLQPPFDNESRQIRDDLNNYCQQRRYGKLKTVKSKGPYDYYSFHNLIKRASDNRQNKPSAIFIDHYILHIPINKILWAVLGTLNKSKQIKVYAYVKERGVLSIRPLKNHESNFLCQAVVYDMNPDMGSWHKWRTITRGEIWQRIENLPYETSRYYNWIKDTNPEMDSDIVE